MDKKEIFEIANTIPGTGGRPDYVENLYTIVSKLPDNAIIIELGTQSGGSAVVFALTVKERGGHVYCIDPCFIELHNRPEQYNKYTIGGYTLDGVKEILKKYDLEDTVTLLPGTSEEILSIWEKDFNKKFDLLYIDADHSYEGMKIDIQWERFAKEKAIILLDDWIKPTEKACLEYMSNKPNWRQRKDGTFWPLFYTRIYPRELHKTLVMQYSKKV